MNTLLPAPVAVAVTVPAVVKILAEPVPILPEPLFMVNTGVVMRWLAT